MHDLKQRYLFIDLLRFVAAFLMIQGHVFDAVLSPQVKAHLYYSIHDFFHGFVAYKFKTTQKTAARRITVAGAFYFLEEFIRRPW